MDAMKMAQKKQVLAFDFGASSGRAMLGSFDGNTISYQEIHRFSNDPVSIGGTLYWDVLRQFYEIKQGIVKAKQFGPIDSIAIDTWGVDFGLLNKNGDLMGIPVHYRDSRTEGERERLEAILPFSEHYARTGIQYQPFNTAYQLAALNREHPEQLAAARTFLMVPDYLNYKLTGVAANEYTNASTTALVGAGSRDWDVELIAKLGIPRAIFQPIRMPGTALGRLTPEVREAVGFDCTVLLPATHDTGSAWLAVPARDENAVYLSSGTWSLLGVENGSPITTPASCAANFTNEGGYGGTYRYLKNIMGLWMIQSVRHEINDKYGFAEICAMAEEAKDFPSRVDANDECFLAPANMTEEVKDYCRRTGQKVPETLGEIATVIYTSLAECYAKQQKNWKRSQEEPTAVSML